MRKITHLDEKGQARMVDISAKEPTIREATAEAVIVLSPDAYDAVMSAAAPKGDVFATARLAGIMAAKRTSELIPLCHPIALSKAEIAIEAEAEKCALRVVAAAKTQSPTGVEMEALTAACVAALTIYDMTKGIDRGAVIELVRLLSKSGGKSGVYAAPAPAPTAAPRVRRAVAGSPTETVQRAPAADAEKERDALRAFMAQHRLRATQWAKQAGIPAGELFSFLTGRSRVLPRKTAEALARAAAVRVEDLFARHRP